MEVSRARQEWAGQGRRVIKSMSQVSGCGTAQRVISGKPTAAFWHFCEEARWTKGFFLSRGFKIGCSFVIIPRTPLLQGSRATSVGCWF